MGLIIVGLVAGLFSALFGVGGGIVIVPMLLLLHRFTTRVAMATSLVSIAFVAIVGSITYALHGEVKPGAAALVGIPAAFGAVGGPAATADPHALAVDRLRRCARRRCDRAVGERLTTLALVAFLGLVAGVFAGLFGVGGESCSCRR